MKDTIRKQKSFEELELRDMDNKEAGREEGEIIKLISLIRRKKAVGQSVAKIAEDLLEDKKLVENIYQKLEEHPDLTDDEIMEMLEE